MRQGVLAGAIFLTIAASVSITFFLGAGDKPSAAVTGSLDQVLERLKSIEKRLAQLEKPKPSEVKITNKVLESRLLAVETTLLKKAQQEKKAQTTALKSAAKLATKAELTNPEAEKQKVLAVVKEQVAVAVDKKVAELKKKESYRRNKEPTLDMVSDALKLNATQTAVIEREVRDHQRKIRELLDTPLDDGTVLIDILVDAMAYGQAKRPEAGGQFMKFISLLQKTVPGTDQTYQTQLATVKSSLTTAFKRELTEQQFTEFEEWKFEPDRMKGISDSPFSDLEERIKKRTLELPDK
jgi:hypothetical protein